MPNWQKDHIHRGFFLTLTRSKADLKNQTIPSSTDHTIQNARPRWINTNASLTHCWMSHAFSLHISFCSLIRVTFNKKGPWKRKNIWETTILPPPLRVAVFYTTIASQVLNVATTSVSEQITSEERTQVERRKISFEATWTMWFCILIYTWKGRRRKTKVFLLKQF